MRTETVGGDLGLIRDASAFCAIAQRGNYFDVEDIIELKPARNAPLKLSAVCQAGADFAQEHGAHVIHVDHHVLEPAREHMPRGVRLEPVSGGQDAKADRFATVRNLLNEERVRIPRRFIRLANQLREIVSRPTSAGGLQITLPRRAGVHGDIASAFVLALSEAAAAARHGAREPTQYFPPTLYHSPMAGGDFGGTLVEPARSDGLIPLDEWNAMNPPRW